MVEVGRTAERERARERERERARARAGEGETEGKISRKSNAEVFLFLSRELEVGDRDPALVHARVNGFKLD